MSGSINLSLKAGERIFINGAVLRVDRKVCLELLNDATFLLEGHVLQVEDANTPLRQLYFVVQAILMDPLRNERAQQMFKELHAATMELYRQTPLAAGLERVSALVDVNRPFEALKMLRTMFPIERDMRRPEVHHELAETADAA